jgi:hypothetical protein
VLALILWSWLAPGLAAQAPDAMALVQLGAPATNKPWTSLDYERARFVLEELPLDQLPRLDHPHLQRWLSLDNRPNNADPGVMLGEVTMQMEHNRALAQRYAEAGQAGMPVGAEQLALSALTLRQMGWLWESLDVLLNSAPPDSPSRAAAVARARSGTANALAAHLSMLAAQHSLPEPTLLAAITELSAVYAPLQDRLDLSQRAALQVYAETQAAALPEGQARQSLLRAVAPKMAAPLPPPTPTPAPPPAAEPVEEGRRRR